MRVLLFAPVVLAGITLALHTAHAADLAPVSSGLSAVQQQDGRTTFADLSVMNGNLMVEVTQPAGAPAQSPAEMLARVGGNIYALAGNDGGITNAGSAKMVDGHLWLVSAAE